MENIFTNVQNTQTKDSQTVQKTKTSKPVRLSMDLLDQLQKLNKGTYEDAIRSLLQIQKDNSLTAKFSQLKNDTEDRLDRLEENLSRVMKKLNLF